MVLRVQQGQGAEVWEHLSRKIVSFLATRFGAARLPPGTDAGDFTNEVMIRVLAHITGFQDRGKDSFWGWIHTIAASRFNDFWRRYQRDLQIGLVGRGADPSDTQVVSAEPLSRSEDSSPTHMLRAHELEAAERDCVARLSKDMRDVYTMRRVEELSFAAISARMGGTKEVTLRSTYVRARDYVCECIGKKIDEFGRQWSGWC